MSEQVTDTVDKVEIHHGGEESCVPWGRIGGPEDMSAVEWADLLEEPCRWKWKGLKVDSKENDGARPTQS